MPRFYEQYVCPYDKHYSLIIEDDGRVSYAYLLKGLEIISDVWLYNRQEAPNKADWAPDNMPFLNPKEYINDASVLPITTGLDITLEWICQNELKQVNVFIRRELIAVLQSKSRIGFSVLVCKDGPLAKKWPRKTV